MNKIKVDLERTVSDIDRNIFSGYLEPVGCMVYGSAYDPDSPLADEDGLRSDVRELIQRLNLPNVRYGGNFFSGYRWMDGVGPREERPSRHDLAWDKYDTNEFGTNEFIKFCHKMNIEPYICTNCGDGDMREAADWVEYCNGTGNSALSKLRQKHGFEEPHKVKYWGIGNEVDGPFQIGYKTPEEYARAVTEYGKVMKRVDPDIKLAASAACMWEIRQDMLTQHPMYRKTEWVERGKLILEQAGDLIDYMALHLYSWTNQVKNHNDLMSFSEVIEGVLSSYEGLMRAVCTERDIRRPIYIAMDEWGAFRNDDSSNVGDALVTGMYLNAFIRHAYAVRMANFTPTVVSFEPTPMQTSVGHKLGKLVPQTIYYPFELYSRTCGQQALDVFWEGETFIGTYHGREYTGIRTLDVAATLDESKKRLVVYVINRNQKEAMETTISLADGQFAGSIQASVINGPDIKSANTLEKPDQVVTRESALEASGKSFTCSFEPHSVTALVCTLS